MLNDEDRTRLSNFKEEDNPMIMKLTFKREIMLLIRLILFAYISSLFLYSCGQRVPNHKDYPVLEASLKETNTSLFDIFEKVELISLETKKESLIEWIDKIVYYDGRFYLLDSFQGALFIFEHNGAYIDKIHRIGRGPGEYQYINDFFLDSLHSQIGLLSTWGDVFYYDMFNDHQFLKKVGLPHPPNGYSFVTLLSGDEYIFWSTTDNETDALNIVCMEHGGHKVRGYNYEEVNQLRDFTLGPFHNDEKGKVYYMRAFSNNVYSVTLDELKIAYAWDFGKQNNRIKKNTVPDKLQGREFYAALDNGSIPGISYSFSLQNQTDLYYYASVMLFFPGRDEDIFRGSKHLFFHKQTGKYHFFSRTSEGVPFDRPLLTTNDYMLAELLFDEKETIKAYLHSDEDRTRLANFKEEDNPMLLKLTFKR